ncbi:MAG TPA: MGMT family protein [Vicinamibacterales bacterium]|nr:MGMT family protein [Vicinamibacterales bacterium]
MTAFTRRTLLVVSRIPPGRVATYGDVARLAGRPGAARAVGNIMRAAEMPGLPYHRVIAANGRLGGYGANPRLKASLLAAEGVVVKRNRIVKFQHVRWHDKGKGQRAKGKGEGKGRRAKVGQT